MRNRLRALRLAYVELGSIAEVIEQAHLLGASVRAPSAWAARLKVTVCRKTCPRMVGRARHYPSQTPW